MITGYHTVEDRNNPDHIELEGPFLCKDQNAWLGQGYYFWDSNIVWAHDWGKGNMRRQNNPWLKGYVIGQAQIETDPAIMYDLLGNVNHQLEFKAIIELMEQDESYQKVQPLVPEILQFMVDRGFFTHKSVRAADEPPAKIIEVDFRPPRNRRDPQNRPYMTIGQRVQICLYEKSAVTLRDFSIVFPKKYLK